jgi:hypothetical protein
MARTPKPTPTRLKDELEQSNLFGADVFDLLTTQHLAHGADLLRAYCQETGRPPNVLKLTLSEITDWLDSQPASYGGELDNAARRVAIEVFFQIQTAIATDTPYLPSRSPSDHVDPFDYDWLAQEEEYRRNAFNSDFAPEHHQDLLICE